MAKHEGLQFLSCLVCRPATSQHAHRNRQMLQPQIGIGFSLRDTAASVMWHSAAVLPSPTCEHRSRGSLYLLSPGLAPDARALALAKQNALADWNSLSVPT